MDFQIPTNRINLTDNPQDALDMITINAVEFERQLERAASFMESQYVQVVRKVVIDLFANIVVRTPVDTGRARANWNISSSGESSYRFLSSNMLEKIKDFTFTIHDDEIIIYNNLEYIEALENGHSDQAPVGMVSISLIEFDMHIRNEMRKLGWIE